MTKNDFLNILSDASQFHEGWIDGSVSVKNNNPGNLKFAGQPGATVGVNNFAVFPDFYSGKQAHINDLRAKCEARNWNLSLLDLFQEYLGTDANPTDVGSYALTAAGFFNFLNWEATPTSVFSFILQQEKPTLLVVLNNISVPTDWHNAQKVLWKLAIYIPDFGITTRDDNTSLNGGFDTDGVLVQKTQSVLQRYCEGQQFNTLLWNRASYPDLQLLAEGETAIGKPVSQAYASSAFSSVIFSSDLSQPDIGNDRIMRTLFHEFIHMLFGVAGNPDTLHAQLNAGSGIAEDYLPDLLAAYGPERNYFFGEVSLIVLLKKLIGKLLLLFKGRSNNINQNG